MVHQHPWRQRPHSAGEGQQNQRGRSRAGDPGVPEAVSVCRRIAPVWQQHRPGPPVSGEVHAGTGSFLPLPEPGRLNHQGTGSPLAAGCAGWCEKERQPPGAGRYPRFHRGTAPLPRALLQAVRPCRRNAQVTCSRRSEEHTSELQSRPHLVCRLLLEKKKNSKTVERNAIPKALLCLIIDNTFSFNYDISETSASITNRILHDITFTCMISYATLNIH